MLILILHQLKHMGQFYPKYAQKIEFEAYENRFIYTLFKSRTHLGHDYPKNVNTVLLPV